MPVAQVPRAPLDAVEGLHAVCAQLGLDATGARLLRNVNNAVFLLRRAPVVVRLVTLPSYVPRASVAVAAGRLFAEHGVPAIRLLPGWEQPVQVGEHVATVWRAVPSNGPRPTAVTLAHLLRSVHGISADGAGLPEWDPLGDLANRVQDNTFMPASDRDFLLGRIDRLAEALTRLEFGLPRSVLHGDAHLGNLVPGPDGAVLCDFDSCSVGPPEWDLAPVAVADIRFGRPAEHQRSLAAEYGFDVTTWDGFGVLRDIRDLKIVAGVFPGEEHRPAAYQEFRRRMVSLRRGRVNDRWTLLPS